MNLFEISCNINCENVTFGVLFYKFWGCFEACRPARNKWCQKWDSNPVDRDIPPLQHDNDSFGADHLNARINLHWIIEWSVVPTYLLKTLIDFMGFRKVSTLWPEHYLKVYHSTSDDEIRCFEGNASRRIIQSSLKSIHWPGGRTVSCFRFEHNINIWNLNFLIYW